MGQVGNEGVDNSWDISPVSTPFSMLSQHGEFNKITNTNMCHWKGYGLKSFGGVKKCLGLVHRQGWGGKEPLILSYTGIRCRVMAIATEYGVASFGLKLQVCFNVSLEEIHLAI